MKIVITSFLGVLVVAFLWIFGPVLAANLFHPKHRQRRNHAKRGWEYGEVEIPHKSLSSEETVWFERQVKHSEGEYFIRNGKPRCNGYRWEKEWKHIQSERIIELIEEQL